MATWCINEIIRTNIFPAHFSNFIFHNKKIGYNINILRQTACLVINQITVDNFAFPFNCMPAGRNSDSMTVPP